MISLILFGAFFLLIILNVPVGIAIGAASLIIYLIFDLFKKEDKTVE